MAAMSGTRSGVRAFLGLALLACMFAGVTILTRQPEPRRCLRSHRATAMQPLFAPACAGASCAGGGVDAVRLRVVGFAPVHFQACDAWDRAGGDR